MKGYRASRKLFSAFVVFIAVSVLFCAGTALGAGGLISIDSSVFIQIVNFLFLIWVLNLLLYKPIRNILIQRKEKVSGLEERIDTLGRDAQEKETAFVTGIKEARVKGLAAKETLIQEASEEERRIIEDINQKAPANLAEVRDKIAGEAEAARKALQQEVEGFAEAIGQKILGRTV